MLDKLKTFARRNPVRVQAFVTSTLLLLASIYRDFPAEVVASLILATLGLGEFSQRVENNKTTEALQQEPPTE